MPLCVSGWWLTWRWFARRLGAAALLGSLTACGSYPRVGDVVTVAISGPLSSGDATRPREAAAGPALRAAGMGPAEVAAGRVLRVQCAVGTDSWWDSLAVLPEQATPLDGGAWTLRVLDRGDNGHLPVNTLLAPVLPRLGPGGLAYRVIPDWRERGLARNFERQPPAGGPEPEYQVVLGSWMVRCQR